MIHLDRMTPFVLFRKIKGEYRPGPLRGVLKHLWDFIRIQSHRAYSLQSNLMRTATQSPSIDVDSSIAISEEWKTADGETRDPAR